MDEDMKFIRHDLAPQRLYHKISHELATMFKYTVVGHYLLRGAVHSENGPMAEQRHCL